MAKLTLIGLSNYMEANDDDLFKKLQIPADIDRQTLIDNILLKGGEFESLYSNPYFIQNAVGVWSSKWQRTMQKWVDALAIEYSPLENYDRIEEYTDTDTGTVSNIGTIDNTGTVDNTGSVNNTGTTINYGSVTNAGTITNTGTQTNNNKVSAFDSDVMRDNSEDVREDDLTQTNDLEQTTDMSQTNNLTQTNNLKQTNNLTQTNNLVQTNDLIKKHTARLRGNIGVTTSQQMLQSELDIAIWNLYDHIADLFLQEFVIPIY